MKRLAALLLAIAASCSFRPAFADEAPAAPEPGVRLHALAAAEVTLGADEPSIRPAAEIEIDGPLPIGGRAPVRVYARLRTYGLQGDTVDLTDVATFRAAALDLGITKRIGRVQVGDQEVWTSLEVGYGVITISDDGAAERLHYPRAAGAGLRVEERSSGAWLSLLYGRHQVAGDRGWGQVMVEGAVPLSFSDRVLVLGGEAILSAGPPGGDPEIRQRDAFRLYVGVSLPELIGVFRR